MFANFRAVEYIRHLLNVALTLHISATAIGNIVPTGTVARQTAMYRTHHLGTWLITVTTAGFVVLNVSYFIVQSA